LALIWRQIEKDLLSPNVTLASKQGFGNQHKDSILNVKPLVDILA
jgi:hypothetical protein